MRQFIFKAFLYFIIINLFSVAVCYYDKFKARTHGSRVSEKNLFFYSLIGGSIGMYITMQVIHHKTRKRRFMVGIPLIIVLQIISIGFIFYRFW